MRALGDAVVILIAGFILFALYTYYYTGVNPFQ